MKTHNFVYKLTFTMLLSILVLLGCDKDDQDIIVEDTSTEIASGMQVINYKRSNKSNSAGKSGSFSGTTLAVFSDEATYLNYIEDLEAQSEAWDDAFLAQWSHLNDDELNAKEEELNFDSEKPLTDFENATGLSSLRQKYMQEEDNWLNNEVLDEATDPDNKSFYDFDESEMTVINNIGEVQIGTTIIKRLTSEEVELINLDLASRPAVSGASSRFETIEDGASLIIADQDYDALIDFNNGDTSVIGGNGNVTVDNNTSSNDCDSGRTRRKFFSTATNRRIKAIIKVPQPKWGNNGKIKTKIKSYKKGGLFGWKRWRTKIAAGANGRVFNSSCANNSFFIDRQMTSIKRRKKRVFKWDNPNYGAHVVENGGMVGLYYQNGITKELPLTW